MCSLYSAGATWPRFWGTGGGVLRFLRRRPVSHLCVIQIRGEHLPCARHCVVLRFILLSSSTLLLSIFLHMGKQRLREGSVLKVKQNLWHSQNSNTVLILWGPCCFIEPRVVGVLWGVHFNTWSGSSQKV